MRHGRSSDCLYLWVKWRWWQNDVQSHQSREAPQTLSAHCKLSLEIRASSAPCDLFINLIMTIQNFYLDLLWFSFRLWVMPKPQYRKRPSMCTSSRSESRKAGDKHSRVGPCLIRQNGIEAVQRSGRTPKF